MRNSEQPLKKLDTQVVDLDGYAKSLFLVSLLELKGGWSANHAQPTRRKRSSCNPCVGWARVSRGRGIGLLGGITSRA